MPYLRMKPNEISTLRLSRVGRAAAFYGHGLDLDMDNAWYNLWRRFLTKKLGASEFCKTYPMIERYCTYTREWRSFMNEYDGCSGKLCLVKLLFLARPGPEAELPFLIKLASECHNLAAFVKQLPEFAVYENYYCEKGRRNPKASRFAAAGAKLEHLALTELIAKLREKDITVMCPIYDGCVVLKQGMAVSEKIQDVLSSISLQLQVPLSVKEWDCSSLTVVPFPARLFSNGAKKIRTIDLELKTQTLNGDVPAANVCLVRAMYSILGIRGERVVENGPWSVSDYRKWAHANLQDSKPHNLILVTGQMESTTEGRFLVYQKMYSGLAHFFTIEIVNQDIFVFDENIVYQVAASKFFSEAAGNFELAFWNIKTCDPASMFNGSVVVDPRESLKGGAGGYSFYF